jgi:hypothetical protein
MATVFIGADHKLNFGLQASCHSYFRKIFFLSFALVSHTSNVTDPGSGVFFTPDPRSGMGKKTGSGINIPDHFSQSLETFLTAKNTYIICCGSGIWNRFDPGSGMEKFGSGINIPDLHY